MFFFLPIFSSHAEEVPVIFTERVALLEKKIDQIEANQNQIMIENQKIHEVIEQLRVLAHRRPKLVNR